MAENPTPTPPADQPKADGNKTPSPTVKPEPIGTRIEPTVNTSSGQAPQAAVSSPEAPAVVRSEVHEENKRKEADKKAQDADEMARRATAVSETANEVKRLAALEAARYSGAPSLTSKASLLDPGKDVTDAHEDTHHLRWVNVADPGKVGMRQAEGYERVPESEGGRQVADVALFRIPKEKHEARVNATKRQTADQLKSAAENDFHRTVEAVAKELRDKHGYTLSDKQLRNISGEDR